MKRWWWTTAAALLALPACYANAHAARESQTMSARGFYCPGEPRVRCPNRSGGRCTGWDRTWTAVCSSNRSEWTCSLHDDGSSRCQQTAAGVPRAEQHRRAPSRPTTSGSRTAGGEAATSDRSRRRGSDPAEVTVERDEFTGETTVRYDAPVEWEDGRQQRADFTVLTHPSGTVGVLLVTTAHRSWRWLECHTTHMLVDGEIVELGEAEHNGDVSRGFVVEQVRVPLSRDAIVTLTQAAEVRVRICNDVMRLSEPSIRVLADLGPALAEHGSDEETGATEAERPPNPYGGASDAEPADSGSEDEQAGERDQPSSGGSELDGEAGQEGSR